MTSDPGQAPSLAAVGRSATILTGGAVLAQGIGIARELFLAANVGVSADLDALLIAIVLPTTLAGAVTTGTTRALVPVYMEAAEVDGQESARRLAGIVLAWAGIAGLVIWLMIEAFANAMITVAGPGLSAAGHDSAIAYLHFLAPVAFVSAITVILYTVCQAEEQFAALAVATIAGPAATLITMALLWQSWGLGSLAIGSLVGPLATLAILVASSVRASILPIPIPRRDARLGALVRHAAPITLGTAILQINIIGDRAIASLLGPGAVSTLRYADVLVRVPIGAIAPAWGSAIFPALVRSTLGRPGASLALTSERALRYLTAFFVPVAALTVAVAPLAVSVAYGRGAFTASDVGLTAPVLAGFAPLLVIVMTLTVLTGAHNARRRGQLLLVGGTINVVLNIALDLALGWWLGVAGIALASSIAQGVVAMLFIGRLVRSEDSFPLQPLARTFMLAMLASLPVALAVGGLVWSGLVPLDAIRGGASLIIFGAVGGLGYLITARAIGMEEPQVIARFAVGQLLHWRKI